MRASASVTRKLKHVCTLVMGQSPPSESYNQSQDGPPFLQGCAEFGEHHPTPKNYCAIAAKLCMPGDILFSVRAPVGAMNTADRCYGIGRGLCAIRPRTGDLDARYLRFVVSHAVEALNSIATGSTYEAISVDQLGNAALPIPDHQTQRILAAFLDRKTAAIDQLIEKKERLIELLQEKRQALITQAVTKGLDPSVPMKDSGVDWLEQIPSHWTVCRVRFHVSLSTSGSRGWSGYVADDGPLFLQSGNLDSDLGLDLRLVQHVVLPRRTEGTRTRVHSGDVLVCITGALTGNVAHVQADLGEAYVNQHLCVLRPRPQSLSAAFLAFVLKSEAGQQQFEIRSYGLKTGLGLEDVRDVVFPRPPNDEQVAVAHALNRELRRFLEVSRRIDAQLSVLREYRQAVISAAVTGQIDVTAEAA